MSDGTTATTLAPETDEMSKVRDVFERALNAIMEQSKLSSEVAELRKAVQQMQASVEFLQTRNSTLDEHIQIARRQRDQAESELREVRASYSDATQSLDIANERGREKDNYIGELELKIANTAHERDDALMRGLELEEENGKLKTRLNAIELVLHPVSTLNTPPEQPRTEGGQFGKWEDQPGPKPEADPEGPVFSMPDTY